MKKCPECFIENNDDSKFCKACGSSLVPVKVQCPQCGTEASSTDAFCDQCGYALKKPKSQQFLNTLSLNAVLHHTRYIFVIALALLMFGLSFGTAVKYEGSIPIGSFSNYSIGQSTTRIYRSTTQMLFNDQEAVLEQIEDEAEAIIIDLGLGGVESVRDFERLMSRLNILSAEYAERDYNENQVLVYGVSHTLILLSIQAIPIVIITLTTINYLKGKDIKKILPLFLLISGLILLFSRLQLNVDMHSPRLGNAFIALMVLGFTGYVLMTLLDRLIKSDQKVAELKALFTLPRSLRYGTIALACITLLIVSGGLIKSTVHLDNFSNTSGAITMSDLNSSIKYNDEDHEFFDQVFTEYNLEARIFWTFTNNTTNRSRQLATENFDWYTLFGGQTFDSESTQQTLVNLTFSIALFTSLVLITNIVFLFFKETYFKTHLGLSIAQVILLLALAGLSILWAQAFNNAFDLTDGIASLSVSLRIAIPLIIAVILSFIQLSTLIFSRYLSTQPH